jgi:type I restriction enzyme S subunit
MKGWKSLPLGDVINLKRGFDLPDRDRMIGAVPIVSSSGISGYHSKAMTKAPGVVTGRYGTLGKVFYIKEDFWPLNTSLFVENFRGNDSKFIAELLSVYLTSDLNAAGAVPGVNRNHLHRMNVKLPPLPIQRKIAAILSAYDDLIENNNRRVALLEKMGEELYREWFVRLRFPGHESTKIVKGVPEGWTVASIGSVSNLVKRGVSPAYDESSGLLVLNQKCIRNGKVSLGPARKHSSKVPNEKFLQKYDVLVNSTGVGTLGRVAIFSAEINSLTVDSHVTIARANSDKINSLYYASILCTKQEFFENLAIGATGQVELNKDGIERVEFLLPPNELQNQFGDQKEVLLQLIEKTQQKQATLTLSRDRLLTRLMSGKIDLEALDIAFPPSMQEAA